MKPEELKNNYDYLVFIDNSSIFIKFTEKGIILGFEKNRKFHAQEFIKE